MKVYMLMIAIGKDRPGIVDNVSEFLFERGANIEDSRMSVMGCYFSIMALFSCAPEASETIKKDLNTLGKLSLKVSLYDADSPEADSKKEAIPLSLNVTAMDHPGIVKRVVHVLHHHNANIQSLNTQVTRAPLTGTDLFNLTIQAAVPAEKRVAMIKEDLSKLALEIDLDLSFNGSLLK